MFREHQEIGFWLGIGTGGIALRLVDQTFKHAYLVRNTVTNLSTQGDLVAERSNGNAGSRGAG